ncbi:hypothetical protein [Rhizobium sp. 9140]|uniref:hypothetical protein n=1 Tax=Rhizobium sp. 9140 TaxID=1761900 RepID=UPI0015862D3D|nr:hypothetical protein [Rhizobium sp. 9140]
METEMRLCLPLFLLFAATSNANAQDIEVGRGEAVIIEHAEIVREPGFDLVYLAIWNGSGTPRVISKISASGYTDIRFARIKSEETSYQSVAAAVLTIPSRSEIVMTPSTVFLSMVPREKYLLPVDIMIEFQTGDTISATATEKPSSSDLVHHDHGVPE